MGAAGGSGHTRERWDETPVAVRLLAAQKAALRVGASRAVLGHCRAGGNPASVRLGDERGVQRVAEAVWAGSDRRRADGNPVAGLRVDQTGGASQAGLAPHRTGGRAAVDGTPVLGQGAGQRVALLAVGNAVAAPELECGVVGWAWLAQRFAGGQALAEAAAPHRGERVAPHVLDRHLGCCPVVAVHSVAGARRMVDHVMWAVVENLR